MKKLFFPIVLLLVLASCEEVETPKAQPHVPGNVTRDEVFITSDYKNQVFYDLVNGRAASKNEKVAWDFAISFSEDRFHLNSSTYTQIADTKTENWEDVTKASDYTFEFDHHSQDISKIAVGKWKENNIYLIDRGFDVIGKPRGIFKFKLQNTSENEVIITYGTLSGKQETISVKNTEDHRLEYISFDSKSQLLIAPEDNSWHLCFTQYTHIIEEETPYLVTGIVLNHGVISTEFSDSLFANISLEQAKGLDYSEDASVIGYDWKTYSYDQGSFSVNPERNYVLKIDNDYYKLHFLDFYNSSGEKGNFLFEYQKL